MKGGRRCEKVRGLKYEVTWQNERVGGGVRRKDGQLYRGKTGEKRM